MQDKIKEKINEIGLQIESLVKEREDLYCKIKDIEIKISHLVGAVQCLNDLIKDD